MKILFSNGWSLLQAAERTGSVKSNKSRLWELVENGQLIAFGRPYTQSDREWMPGVLCRSLDKQDVHMSSASGGGRTFVDILLFPVLCAPNVVDILDGKSLKLVFWDFILHDPEVEFLALHAVQSDPDLLRVYDWGWRDPRDECCEWPLVFSLGGLAGGQSENSFDYRLDPLSHAAQAAADLVCLRYEALLSLLRDETLDALGDPVTSSGTYRILPSIWSHHDYFFDVKTGDVCRRNFDAKAGLHEATGTRWSAVMLKKPQQVEPFHVKPLVPHQARRFTTEPQDEANRQEDPTNRNETKSKSKTECERWLCSLMRASPDKPTMIKMDLFKEAQKKWPNTLSERSFDAARNEAIRKTGAWAWAEPGRPSKRSD